MTVWAFNKVDEEVARQSVYESVKAGKSRFGWSREDANNLLLKDNWTDCHSRQLFLLQVKVGDWIVHVNTPTYGNCVAAQVVSTYNFDDGLVNWEIRDFRHYFDIDTESIVEFHRHDKNVLPSVNLAPRQRYHRVYQVDAFLKSIDNLKTNAVELADNETREEFHLRAKNEDLLAKVIDQVHEMHRGSNLERYLAKVFRNIPGVIDVNENGFGWGTDHGADLIITMASTLSNIEFENRIIVQIKSFGGSICDPSAVDQVKRGIEKYDGTAGIIMTTAKATEELEDKIHKVSEEIGKPIDLIAHTDLAKFIIKHAAELLFNFNGIG